MPEEKQTPERAPAPPAVSEEMDEAMQSLAAALRVSFFLLKIVMLTLIVFYLVISSFYKVGPNQVGLSMCFGAVTGMGEERVKRPGLHVAWPKPVGEVVLISTAPRSLQVNTFWRRTSEQDLDKAVEKDREKGGEGEMEARIYKDAMDWYLMTGDFVEVSSTGVAGAEKVGRLAAPNMVQARFAVHYTVDPGNAEKYFLCVGANHAAKEEQIVRGCLQAAAVRAVARRKVYGVLRDTHSLGEDVRALLQSSLDSVQSGITVTGVSMEEKSPPKNAAQAFNAVSGAVQQKDRMIKEAEAYRAVRMTETVGEEVGMELYHAFVELWTMETLCMRDEVKSQEGDRKGAIGVSAKEKARRKAEMARLRHKIETLFHDPKTGHDRVGGRVSDILRAADTYSKQVFNEIKGEARALTDLVKEYEDAPDPSREMANLLEILRVKALAGLLGRAREKYFFGQKRAKTREIRLQISRDPDVLKAGAAIKQTR